MKLLNEFKKFAIKGNVIDLATAVIIGGAFGKIVSSLVADIIMPLIGLIIGGVDFTVWKITLRAETFNAAGQIIKPALTMNTGVFIQNIVDFLIIAGSIFFMIRFLLKLKNRFNKPEEVEPTAAPEPSAEQKLLTEIRDLLKEKSQD